MAVEVGGVAPDFELPSHNDRKVKLSDFRGKKNVFIAFYPLAWTHRFERCRCLRIRLISAGSKVMIPTCWVSQLIRFHATKHGRKAWAEFRTIFFPISSPKARWQENTARIGRKVTPSELCL